MKSTFIPEVPILPLTNTTSLQCIMNMALFLWQYIKDKETPTQFNILTQIKIPTWNMIFSLTSLKLWILFNSSCLWFPFAPSPYIFNWLRSLYMLWLEFFFSLNLILVSTDFTKHLLLHIPISMNCTTHTLNF